MKLFLFSGPFGSGRMNYIIEEKDCDTLFVWKTTSDEYKKYFDSEIFNRPFKFLNPPEKTDADALCTEIIRGLMDRAMNEFLSEDVTLARQKIKGLACVRVYWDHEIIIPSVYPLSHEESFNHHLRDYVRPYREKQYMAILDIVLEDKTLAKSLRKAAIDTKIDDDQAVQPAPAETQGDHDVPPKKAT